MRRSTISLALLLYGLSAHAQTGPAKDTLRVAAYNLLNYPGSTSATRNPEFRKVIHTLKPDILVVGEMTSQTGTDQFLSSVMNQYQAGLYSTIPFHDGPDTDAELFYKSSKITFVSANYISTALRDIAEYVVRDRATGDELRIYSVHLKASMGFESNRLAEATILRNYLNNLPAGCRFIILGDFNIYTSTEPAFQKLIGSESNNSGRTKDPLNAVGTWNNNSSFSHIHTQSPRTRSFDGGSTGGMDDRFDIILTSLNLDSNIVVPSYLAYGNDGAHFNDSINRLPNTAVPDSVAKALHNASDHLPVVANFVFSFPEGATVTIPVPIVSSWNLLSVPITVIDTPRVSIFPNSTVAYFYTPQGYASADTVKNRAGYWVRFPTGDTLHITGKKLSRDTIDVRLGWNLVGSISDSVPVSSIVTIPPGLIGSPFYGYQNGYTEAPTVVPGLGYWMRANQAGKLILKKP